MRFSVFIKKLKKRGFQREFMFYSKLIAVVFVSLYPNITSLVDFNMNKFFLISKFIPVIFFFIKKLLPTGIKSSTLNI